MQRAGSKPPTHRERRTPRPLGTLAAGTGSGTYIWLLRKGQRDNPTKKHLEALADFFGVPPAYFFDDEIATQLSPQLNLLAALRNSSVREIALRVAELSPGSLDAIRGMIEQVSQLETRSNPKPRRPDPS